MRLALPILQLGAFLCAGMLHAAPPTTNSGIVPTAGAMAIPKPSSTPLAIKQPDKLDGAIMDGNGILWAYSRQFPNHLFRFNGTNWSDQAAPFEKTGAMPLELAKMADGSMACLWRLQDQKLGLSSHTKELVTIIGITKGDIPTNSGDLEPPFADSKNRLWITGQFPRLYCADKNGGLRNIHTFQKEELADPSKVLNQYNSIYAVEDGRGRIWAWSDHRFVQHASLRAVFIFDGNKPENPPEIITEFTTTNGDKIDAKEIRSLSKADAHHLWVAVWGRGVFKLDIDSLKLEKIFDPKGQQLDRIEELYQVGEDLYAVVWVIDHAVLWCLRDGNWKQILPNIEAQSSWGCEFVSVPQGVVMRTSRESPWFIPNDGEPVQLTWKYGFPLLGCRIMACFPNGSLLAIGYNGDVFCGPFQFPPREKGSSRIMEIRSHEQQPWVLDSEGTPWTISNDTPNILSRWSAGAWLSAPIPFSVNESSRRARNILSDEQWRIWVLPLESSPQSIPLPVHIYDIHAKKWRIFPSLQEAFLKIRPRPRFLANGHYLHGPEYSPDHRRIAFREETRTYQVDKVWRSEGFKNFWYYDGSLWRDINITEIIGTTDEHALLGPPWFDKDGLLCVNVKDGRDMRKTWQMDASGKWASLSFESRFPTDIWSEKPNPSPSNQPPIPDGCVPDNPDSIVMDNHGVCWLTWKGGLYKAVPGKSVMILRPDEATPFNSYTHLRQVYVDPEGNALIYAAQHTMVAFIVKSISKPPSTHLEINKPEGDSVQARFLETSKQDVEFRWQLDEQGWKATKESSLNLSGLPNGKHTLKVSATDAELQSDAAPATATFTIHVDRKRQMAQLIKKLSDPDYDRRKEAIESLALQPVLSKHSLLKARQTANDDLKWWIDAALQRMGVSR